MKPIKAYQCDFCNKILKSRSGMKSHEDRCFSNPTTKSYITCGNLDSVIMINGRKLTDEEIQIFEYKKEGTYTMEWDRDPEGDGMEYPVLNDQYKYLYEAEAESYCNGKKSILKKLTTKCDYWKKIK